MSPNARHLFLLPEVPQKLTGVIFLKLYGELPFCFLNELDFAALYPPRAEYQLSTMHWWLDVVLKFSSIL